MKRACSSPPSPGRPSLHILERMLGEERDAVEALLAVDGDVVAELLDRLGREGLVDALDLLQADDVGRRLASASGRGCRCAP